MSFSERLQEIRTGFESSFCIANLTEIFERLSYYGAFASLALYLQERLNFSTEQTGTLTGIFGGMVWFLAIFGGAAADRLGFRRALSIAYLILSVAYFLIGKAIRSEFSRLFPNPEKLKKDKKKANIYESIIRWFGEGNQIDILNEMQQGEYEKILLSIPGLKELVEKHVPSQNSEQQFLLMEFVEHVVSFLATCCLLHRREYNYDPFHCDQSFVLD